MSGITINPAKVTNAPGLFSVRSKGYVQGTALSDPAIRHQLVSGILNPSASAPIWGGCGITESLTTAGTEADSIGAVLALATSQANLTGFTVYDQSHAMFQAPESPAPLAPAGGAINFYRLGSGARIALPCSGTVAAALAGSAINVALYWDYTNQVLLSAPGGTAINVKLLDVDTIGNSRVVSYSSGTGFATWNDAGYCALVQI